jgi:hypothetical protein
MLPRLPLDLSTFSILRKSHYLYVDKTKYAYDLITGGRRFFLSRPRRFGKSLFVSTLKEILSGNKDLFDGLWIEKSDYQWHPHGVIVFDFSILGINDADSFKIGIITALQKTIKMYGLEIFIDNLGPEVALDKVVGALYDSFGHVAILVDEYDIPILHALQDAPRASVIRDAIRSFFATIKGLDAYVDFVFITGVSSFAKAGLFSGMNNLQVITLNKRFAGICGYTDEEVDHYFAGYMQDWASKEGTPYAQLRQEIKTWYNGYRFGVNVVAVYNPFSLMHVLAGQEFKNFWFQSGTPTFLINVLKKEHHTFDHEKLETTEDALGVFDVGATPLMALMFQSGYLTIVGYDKETQLYRLDYPNEEVRISLQKYLLEVFARLDVISAERMSREFRAALNNGDIEEAVYLLKQLFAHVPYQLHGKEEKFYHALLQMVLSVSGIRAQSEYSTSHGRIDLVVELPKVLYIMEVKFNASAEVALKQIEERRYYEPFIKNGKPITLLGLEFKREPNNFDVAYAVKYMK